MLLSGLADPDFAHRRCAVHWRCVFVGLIFIGGTPMLRPRLSRPFHRRDADATFRLGGCFDLAYEFDFGALGYFVVGDNCELGQIFFHEAAQGKAELGSAE
jgi:hypothetical protein